MKNCTKCGQLLNDGDAYCNACYTNQYSDFAEFEPKPVYSATFLKVLCTITIIGALFVLIRAMGFIAGYVDLPNEELEVVAYVSFCVGVGKLTGAIFMLQKKLTGLYIYTVAAILAIIVQVYSLYLALGYMEALPGANSTFIIIGAAVAIVILLAFLIMYWLPVNRRLLS